jgi:hypothetical protein
VGSVEVIMAAAVFINLFWMTWDAPEPMSYGSFMDAQFPFLSPSAV